MNDYFLSEAISHNLQIKNPLEIPKVKTTNYGIKSLSFQGPKIWNSFPDEIKIAQNTKQLYKIRSKFSSSLINVHVLLTFRNK